ncbi:ABC transporter ATP-binding protein [Kosmotoga olearia]|uniref:ABC transporter related n=1 Tax=Kosmotoga olearia (strain ATCC BAA-1733 / DSM 21960 / TBF 19.5.1) TaxID=521045 RepID=C5CIN1_KOSOT|nr:ATP-binding cassette domain-containing protein [Kosmotoga olearia]ACR79893.1 ABC transporter related [Kosmotoga olearia TBF 19.5.1]
MIEVSQVHKTFKSRKRTVKAVDGISFKAVPGEIFGLLGPNGAGKTTTLRMIVTLLKPDSGKISVFGYDTVEDAREVRKRVGFLTSDMKLAGSLSPRELMYFFGDLNHIERSVVEKRIEELAEYLGMKDFLDERVSKLSTGMKQKAAIAISLIHDPQVIIFDEPTNGLDIITARMVTEFIKDFKKQGKTIIISTHIMSVAEKLCDKVGIILKGKLVENDYLENLYEKYQMNDLEDIFFAVAEREGELADV